MRREYPGIEFSEAGYDEKIKKSSVKWGRLPEGFFKYDLKRKEKKESHPWI